MEPQTEEEQPGRQAWAALAVLDAIALAYVVYRMPWGFHGIPESREATAAIARSVLFVIQGGMNLLGLCFIAVAACSIAREFRGPRRASPEVAAGASLVLLAGLGVAIYLARAELLAVFHGVPLVMADRLSVAQRLAGTHGDGHSFASNLVALALAAYLAEKYILRWWNLRWPISLVAIGILAYPAWIAWDGERRQAQWIGAQQWKPVAERMQWPQAVEACRALGDGWRLPRSFELAIYLASGPEPVRQWQGAAWTSTWSDGDSGAVVVELAARRGGEWASNAHPPRDQSPCEQDTVYQGRPRDWFAQLLPRLCAAPEEREGMHVSVLQHQSKPEAAALCIKPSAPELPTRIRRVYRRERETR